MEATSSAASDIISGLNSVFPLVSSLGIGGVLGTLFGYWFKDKLERNTENKRKIREAREKQYTDLLNNLMGFFKGWEDKSKQKQFIWDLCANAPVYASDEVIKLSHRYIDSYDKEKKTGEKSEVIYSKLVLAIRKELNKIQGEPTTELTEKDIQVKMLND